MILFCLRIYNKIIIILRVFFAVTPFCRDNFHFFSVAGNKLMIASITPDNVSANYITLPALPFQIITHL